MLCPSVSHFDFSSVTKSAEDPSTALQGWSHLTSVTTTTVSEAGMLHLSKLPSLRFLQLELPSTPMSVVTQKFQHPVFCALQELNVECSSLVLLDAFFERFSIAPKEICLDIIGGVDSARALPPSLSRLSNGCVHDSLECMELYIDDQPTDHVTSIRTAVLRPLFAFRNLRKLDFRAYQNYTLRWDDAVLLQMAKSWPLLEVLHLNRYDHSSRGVTPSAFISLLQHCPCLISVAIIVNWSTIDECDVSPDAPHQGFAHKTLSEAFFGSPRIRHPTRIAAFISAITPNLESIVTWDPQFGRGQQDSKKYITRWKCVCDLIKAFSWSVSRLGGWC
ncbi:hypothetical protein DFJ58DRAFT_228920 [Suillus subalutaceus]|uniref:uncharacterized protein n=1 Tax=Suillus subalutaceus TaxID=48586 RepID=UPI001B876407|nr:uncharacterized protein DFJ58DRAFT_228920 [Suillus subalutaceus]KAG1833233.1 hypothetical protein DFJ58DRAFT_228920 [Suillus subalutaceus]